MHRREWDRSAAVRRGALGLAPRNPRGVLRILPITAPCNRYRGASVGGYRSIPSAPPRACRRPERFIMLIQRGTQTSRPRTQPDRAMHTACDFSSVLHISHLFFRRAVSFHSCFSTSARYLPQSRSINLSKIIPMESEATINNVDGRS